MTCARFDGFFLEAIAAVTDVLVVAACQKRYKSACFNTTDVNELTGRRVGVCWKRVLGVP